MPGSPSIIRSGGNTPTVSVDSSFSILQQTDFEYQSGPACLAFLVQSGSANVDPTWTTVYSNGLNALILSFAPIPPGPVDIQATTLTGNAFIYTPTVVGCTYPFDDSWLAPSGYSAACALPNLPVFNVKGYGATGNGITDDTPAFYAAYGAAIANGGGIIYCPTGIYALCPQTPFTADNYGAIFYVESDDIVFIGDGANRTFLQGYCYGLQPSTTGYEVYSWHGQGVVRFCMFLMIGVSVDTFHVRSMDISGGAGYEGPTDSQQSPQVDNGGIGWDQSHKFLEATQVGSESYDNLLFFNCAIHDWRGEVVWGGGSNPGNVRVVNTSIYSSNASVVSVGGICTIVQCCLGGPIISGGYSVYNGVENYGAVSGQGTYVYDSIASNIEAHGFSLLGVEGCPQVVQRTTMANCNLAGVLLALGSYGAVVDSNVITGSTGVQFYMQQSGYDSPPGIYNASISRNIYTGASYNSDCLLDCNTGGGGYPCTGLTMDANTIVVGTLLYGQANASVLWSGWTVSNTTLYGGSQYGPHAVDGGNTATTIPTWTNTIRLSPSSYSAQGILEDSQSGATATLTLFPGNSASTNAAPVTDLVQLGNNNATKEYLAVSAGYLGQYTPGYQCQFVVGPGGASNWYIPSDAGWNTLSEEVSAANTWVGVNASNLFALIPVLSGIEGTALNYAVDATAAAITADLVITAAGQGGATTFNGAVVTIWNNYDSAEDVLSFSNQNGITGTWDSTKGTMTLAASGASLAHMATALQSVAYYNATGTSTQSRTISFVVTDANSLNSNTVNRVINVGSAPVIYGIEPGPTQYVGGQAAIPITLLQTFGILDVGQVNLTGATIQITGNYVSSEDLLQFTNANGISGSWDGTTGKMTLTGTTTIANYVTALQSITYDNTDSTPYNYPRTVSIQVTDVANSSNVATRLILVTNTYIPSPGPPSSDLAWYFDANDGDDGNDGLSSGSPKQDPSITGGALAGVNSIESFVQAATGITLQPGMTGIFTSGVQNGNTFTVALISGSTAIIAGLTGSALVVAIHSWCRREMAIPIT